ncbi:hypothetical protein A7982_12164 [Minicystis rosea]|nr:hypothetical protein A7982_12164 [Minicystis rosea]
MCDSCSRWRKRPIHGPLRRAPRRPRAHAVDIAARGVSGPFAAPIRRSAGGGRKPQPA